MENPVNTPGATALSKSSSMWEWLTDDFYPRHDKKIWSALGAVAVAVALYFLWSYNHEKSEVMDNKKLGSAYVFLEQGRFLDAESALKEFLAQSPSGLARDKGNLFLGKVYYEQQKYEQALQAYGNVSKGGKSSVLVYSGALHGKAACHMQKKDYAQAVQALDEYLALAMLRSGDPREDVAGKEVVDLSPSVPNALFKQALCYRELGQPDKIKAVLEKLRKAYPGTHEAQNGAMLLATVE